MDLRKVPIAELECRSVINDWDIEKMTGISGRRCWA